MGTGRKILVGILIAVLAALLAAAGFFVWKSDAHSPVGNHAVQAGAETITAGTAAAQTFGAETGAANAAGTGTGDRLRLELETRENNTADTEQNNEAEHAAESEIASEEENEKRDCVLLFAGDVYLSDHVLNAYDRAGGIEGVLDETIRNEIEAADLFMVNQEFPFTDRGKAAEDKQFTFRLPPERIHILKEMGIDVVTLANNHILDFGPEGITDSILALDQAGILHVGAGENINEAKAMVTVELCGRTVGFLGVSRVYMSADWAAGYSHPGVFSTYDPTLALEEIRKAREQVDYLVVYVHWGVERETAPKEYQRTMGRQYIDAGADLVIGSHPHVLQPMEYYNGKPIVYSLGNFVFGSSIPSTELFKVVLGEDEVTVTEIPCTSSGGYTRVK